MADSRALAEIGERTRRAHLQPDWLVDDTEEAILRSELDAQFAKFVRLRREAGENSGRVREHLHERASALTEKLQDQPQAPAIISGLVAVIKQNRIGSRVNRSSDTDRIGRELGDILELLTHLELTMTTETGRRELSELRSAVIATPGVRDAWTMVTAAEDFLVPEIPEHPPEGEQPVEWPFLNRDAIQAVKDVCSPRKGVAETPRPATFDAAMANDGPRLALRRLMRQEFGRSAFPFGLQRERHRKAFGVAQLLLGAALTSRQIEIAATPHIAEPCATSVQLLARFNELAAALTLSGDARSTPRALGLWDLTQIAATLLSASPGLVDGEDGWNTELAAAIFSSKDAVSGAWLRTLVQPHPVAGFQPVGVLIRMIAEQRTKGKATTGTDEIVVGLVEQDLLMAFARSLARTERDGDELPTVVLAEIDNELRKGVVNKVIDALALLRGESNVPIDTINFGEGPGVDMTLDSFAAVRPVPVDAAFGAKVRAQLAAMPQANGDWPIGSWTIHAPLAAHFMDAVLRWRERHTGQRLTITIPDATSFGLDQVISGPETTALVDLHEMLPWMAAHEFADDTAVDRWSSRSEFPLFRAAAEDWFLQQTEVWRSAGVRSTEKRMRERVTKTMATVNAKILSEVHDWDSAAELKGRTRRHTTKRTATGGSGTPAGALKKGLA